MIRLATLLVCLLALAAGCTSGGIHTLPEPPPTSSPTTTAPPVDLSGVALAGVDGVTTTTIVVGPGSATLSGTVSGPEGAVPGAVVRAERLVGDAVAIADVVTAEDGSWALPGILGGRYRLRAFRSPDLLMTKPEVFFLEGRESKVFELRAEPFTGRAVTADMAPNPPIVGQPAELAVLVADQSVDGNGVARAVPVAGARVELFGSGNWRLFSANPTVTDGAGTARWRVQCGATGTQPLAVVVNDEQTFPLGIPNCAPRPTTTTTTSTSSTTSTIPGASTTSSTTSTTQRR